MLHPHLCMYIAGKLMERTMISKAALLVYVLILGGFAATSPTTILAQDDLTTSPPEEVWAQQLFAAAGGLAQVYSGNGLFLTPDGTQVVAIENGGMVVSFSASDGRALWSHIPPGADDGSVTTSATTSAATFTVETSSGIRFSTPNSENSFMVYSLTYKDSADSSVGNDNYT